MTTLTPALRLPALGVAPAVRREAATQAFARTLAPEDVVTGCSSRGLLGPPQRSYLFAMSSMRPAYLRSELATPSKLEAAEMPTLRGFDEEFGQAAGVTQLDRTRSMLLAVALGAAILGGLTLAWLAVDGSVRPKIASSAPTSPRNTAPVESRELVDRLLSQVEALKSEVRELTEAQQQPAHAIAAIEAEQESRRAPPVYWYSDPAALSSEPESGPEPWGVVPLPRRPSEPTSYIALGAAAPRSSAPF
jgi:hypothetical protein